MLVALLGVGVFAAYVKLTPPAQHVAPELHRPAETAVVAPEKHESFVREKPAGPSVEVDAGPQLRVPALSGEEVKLGRKAGSVPSGVKPMVFIANETLKDLKIDKARAIGVDVHGRNALIDFNPEIEKGYGSTEEGELIKALSTALGQFPEIDTFQIVVDGKPLDTLGELDLSDPIAVIRPDGKSSVPEAPTKPGEDPASPSED